YCMYGSFGRFQLKVDFFYIPRCLVQQFISENIADDIVCLVLIKLAGKTENIRFHIASQKQHSRKHTNQNNQYGDVTFQPRCKLEWSFLFNIFFASVTNQSLRKIYGFHYTITLVNTGCAVNTFQLCSISDIDACWANIYTLKAIYTVSFSGSFTVFVFLEFCTARFFFATFMIIGHNNGFSIQQNALQSTVWASYDTNLLAKPRKDEVEYPSKNNQ